MPQINTDTATDHRIRWWILLLLFFAMEINILDRQVLSLVAPVLRDEFHLSNTDYGRILFCFLLGMTLGQIPVGMMMDRLGPRAGFCVIFVGWSLANFLHGFAATVIQFALLRFVLGLNECGAYSGGVKVIGQWFRPAERAFAGGLFNSGSVIGAVVAPPLIVYLTTTYGWRAAFIVPSVIGLLWLIPWLQLYWEPWRHPRLGRAAAPPEVSLAAMSAENPPAPSGPQPSIFLLLTLAPVWGVVLIRAFGGPVTHFYWYWLPEYLKRERGMTLEAIGMFAWMPFLSGGIGNIGGGWLSSHLIRRGWTVNRARKTVFIMGGCLCLLAVTIPFAPSAGAAIAIICLASLGINAMAANLMGLIADLFPQQILARISGMTGVGDGIVSMLMMLLAGMVIDRFSYTPVFIAVGLLPVLSLTALMVLVGTIRAIPLQEIMQRRKTK
ncbi:MAG: MFS transporter [Opitutaceae bacterium]|nr:MFS transporter [Opitutaceae bacterium]